MTLHYRKMQAEDVGRCVAIIAANPLVAPRYGRAIADLQGVWLRVLGSLAFTAVVFEELDSGRTRLLGAGVSAFVSDAFARDIQTPPLFWIGPEMLRRITAGVSPLLSDRDVVRSNTQGGLNLVGWDAVTSIEDAKRVDVLNFLFVSFVELHRGFLIKELLGQADSAEHLQAMRNVGASFFDPEIMRFTPSLSGTAEEAVAKPHLMGSTRELALAGSWLSGSELFSAQRPRFYFSRSEQRLLAAALQGGTDDDLSQRLRISASSVRTCWLSIYGRVAVRSPELLGLTNQSGEQQIGARGKGKKQLLLSYLREHPEELRPVLRKRVSASLR